MTSANITLGLRTGKVRIGGDHQPLVSGGLPSPEQSYDRRRIWHSVLIGDGR